MKQIYSDQDPIDQQEQAKRQDDQLSVLFGRETVQQARLLDVADLNLNEEMTGFITAGLTRLKQLRNHPGAQQDMVNKMAQGERLLLCMWIMDMGLLEKIRD